MQQRHGRPATFPCPRTPPSRVKRHQRRHPRLRFFLRLSRCSVSHNCLTLPSIFPLTRLPARRQGPAKVLFDIVPSWLALLACVLRWLPGLEPEDMGKGN
ncbi:hypothetical protein IQ07DRAFT_306189 [Pyrenochaeta sp. DS3sAY3a]|nr:hypothetical protein IQ07DRAFT_306189 [Pyrenochaeta sp. DS3sAY3a]